MSRDPDFKKALAEVIRAELMEEVKESAAGRGRRRKKMPEGTVTIAFTDIEDSSALLERLGDRDARAVIRRHDDLIRRVIERNEGTEVERAGDSFMVAFSTAHRAVACGLEIQREMAGDGSRQGEPVRVRIGMHTGEVIAEEQGYFGKTVFKASRIADLAAGGEIVVSEATKVLAEDGGFQFEDIGPTELKGLGGTHPLYRVVPQR